MSAALDLAVATPAAPGVLDAIAARAGALMPPLAPRIDREGLYPEEALRSLGAEGLFALHLKAATPLAAPDLGAAIAAMASVGRHCMSTAFCVWCQDAAGWYLENADNPALRESLQPGIASGAVLGGTGLSNPMKSFSGIEQFRLRGSRVAGGWIVSGTLPWVSNLGEGHWFGTVFADAERPEHRIMAMIRCGQPGVTIRQNVRFIALEGTGTYSVRLQDAFIGDDQVLADPAEAMVRRIKPGFILLQTGMGLGVIEACLGLMRESDAQLSHTNRFLPQRPVDFEAALEAARAEIMTLAATPHETDAGFMRRVLEVRLAAGELALAAAQGAILHAGARGYVEGSPQHRRLREAIFVAIVTPSLKHLRQEIAALQAH